MFQGLQRLLHDAFGGSGPEGTHGPPIPEVAVEGAIDIQFRSSNRIEAELNELLQVHTRRTDGADTDPSLHLELLQAFCARVASSYNSWVPNDAALDGARSTVRRALAARPAGAPAPTTPAEPLAVVQGCDGGHPTAVLALILASAAALPAALDAAAGPPAPPTGPMLRSPASQAPDDARLAAARSTLAALAVLLRSRHNAAVLLRLGLEGLLADILAGLVRCLWGPAASAHHLAIDTLQVACSALDRWAGLGPGDGDHAGAGAGDDMGRAMEAAPQPQQGPATHGQQREQGLAVPAAELLSLGRERARLDPGPAHALQHASLRLLRRCIARRACGLGAQAAPATLALVAAGIGPKAPTPRDLRLQTRCVRALACADLDAARQLGLGERFRDLLLAAAGVGGEEASLASGSAQPSCVSEDGSMARPGRQAPGATPSVVPLTATLAEATVALWEWAVGGSIPDSTGPPPDLDLARLQFVLEAGVAAAAGGPALDGADPVPSRRGPCLALLALAAHSVGAAWALPGASPAPSRHAPSAVTRVELLRACRVYDVAFLAAGDAGARGAEDAAARASDGDASPAAGDPVVLVTAVGLLERAAGVPALPDAQAEVGALARMLQAPSDDPAPRLAACAALAALLRRAPCTGAAAAARVGLEAALCSLLALRVPEEGPVKLGVELRLGGGEGGDATWEVSLAGSPGAAQQEAALHTLQALFAATQAAQRAALRRWALVPALFEAHACGTRAVRTASLDLLTGLLAVPAADEDDSLAKAALAAKLMEVLTHKVQGWRKHGTEPITDLMSCMRRALSTQAGELQPLFIQAQGCVQLVHALSQPMPLMQLEPVALAVLATLSALLKDSAPARRSFGEEVGWTVLLAALERACGGLPPSWALLSAVLHLATETCFDPVAAGALEGGTEAAPARPPPALPPTSCLQVANPGALGAYLALLRTARCDVAAHRGLPLLCAVLEASVGNRVSATVAGTTPALLEWLPRAHPHLLPGLLRALRASAGHSLPVADLRAALGLLRPGAGGDLGAHHDGLLSLLGEVAADPTPPAFLHFDPGAGAGSGVESPAARAGLACVAARTGPLLRGGLALSVWLRREAEGRRDAALTRESEPPPRGRTTPRGGALQGGGEGRSSPTPGHQGTLVWIEEAQGRALAVALDSAAGAVWVHTWSPAHAALAFDMGRGLTSGAWHHLCLSLAPGGPLSHATATLWLDGRLQAQQRARYPAFRGHPPAVRLGAASSPSAVPHPRPGPFAGQMAAAFLFDGALSAQAASALCALGPGFHSAFGAHESSAALDAAPQEARALVERGAGAWPRLLCRCGSGAGDGSGAGAGAEVEPSPGPPGAVACRRVPAAAALHSLGGLPALFPLLAQQRQGAASSAGERVRATLDLLGAMLRGSSLHRADWPGQALAVAALLRAAPGASLTPDAARAAFRLAAAAGPAGAAATLRALCCDLALWTAAPLETHLCLADCLVALAEEDPEAAYATLSVPELVAAMLRHRVAGGTGSGNSAPGWSTGEARAARRAYLRAAAALLESRHARPEAQHEASAADGLVTLVAMLTGSGAATELVLDVGHTLLSMLRGRSLARQALICGLEGLGCPAILLPLVGHPDEGVSLLGLRLITACSARPLADGVLAGLQALLLPRPFRDQTRDALLEMTCGGAAWDWTSTSSVPLAINPGVAPLLVQLALRAAQAQRDATLRALCALAEAHAPNRDGLLAWPGLTSLLLDAALIAGRGWGGGREAGEAIRSGEGRGGLNSARPGGNPSDDPAWSTLCALLCHAVRAVQGGVHDHLAPILAHAAMRGLGAVDPEEGRAAGVLVDALLRAVLGRLEQAQGPGEIPLPARGSPSEDDDSWTLVTSWLAEPYLTNACELCALLHAHLAHSLPLLCGAQSPTAGADSCDEWRSGAADAARWLADPGASPPGTLPAPAWRLLGVAPGPLPHDTLELEEAGWRLLHRLVGSEAARAALRTLGLPAPQALPALLRLLAVRGLRRPYAPRATQRAAAHARALAGAVAACLDGAAAARELHLLLACCMKLDRAWAGESEAVDAELWGATAAALHTVVGAVTRALIVMDAFRRSQEDSKGNGRGEASQAATPSERRSAAVRSPTPEAVLDVGEVVAAARTAVGVLLQIPEALAAAEAGRTAVLAGRTAALEADAAAAADGAADATEQVAHEAARQLGLQGRAAADAAALAAGTWKALQLELEAEGAIWRPAQSAALWRLDTGWEDGGRRRRRLVRLVRRPIYCDEAGRGEERVSEGRSGRSGVGNDGEEEGADCPITTPAPAEPTPTLGRLVAGTVMEVLAGEQGALAEVEEETGAGARGEEHGPDRSCDVDAQSSMFLRKTAAGGQGPSQPGGQDGTEDQREAASPARPGSGMPALVRTALTALPAAWQSTLTGGGQLPDLSCELVWPGGALPGCLDLRSAAGTLRFWPSDTGDLCAGGEGTDTGAQELAEEAEETGAAGWRWRLEEVAAIHHTRHLLQPVALEVFFRGGSGQGPVLLSFPSQRAKRAACDALARACPQAQVLDDRRKKERAAELQGAWCRWEMSTFDYLMALNTLAGRTYNDLNQYPVFPWVLADYSSPTLDLSDPTVYRDLTKPIGALNPHRLASLRERSASLIHDPDVPPFLYGSHYSSAGSVLFYLLRLEPFTRHARALQGGRLDHADRLFHSLEATWQNCLNSTSDVKELTPEFFYLPDFLENGNAYHLGTRQDGVRLGDVQLPAWAGTSPHTFIHAMREALEGPHASASMHQWIDLVFGCKQRGPAAVAADNTFYYLTYEDMVDLDRIADPVQRAAVAAQIRHFGQTPSQLFPRRPHPPRRPPPAPSRWPLLHAPECLRVVAALPGARPSTAAPVTALALGPDGTLHAVHAAPRLAAYRWLAHRTEAGPFTFGQTAAEPAGAGQGLLEPCGAGLTLLDPGPGPGVTPTQAPPVAFLPGTRHVALGGADATLRCAWVESGAPSAAASYHQDAITCLAADEGVVVTGSRDATLLVWETGARGVERAPRRPRATLHGHPSPVVAVAVSSPLDLVLSASAGGTLLLHGLRDARLLRSIPCPATPALLAVAPGPGVLLTHSHADLAIHGYGLSGQRLASVEVYERLADMQASPDGRLLLTVGSGGGLAIRDLATLRVHLKIALHAGPLTALVLTPEQCVLVGTRSGGLILLAPDLRRTVSPRPLRFGDWP